MLDLVKDYYGRQLTGTADLRTSACCDTSQLPDWLRPLLAHVHPEVRDRYYGCGLVVPPLIEGARILVTAVLVIFASTWGMPVSTTHVSVGSISGVGARAGTLEWPALQAVLLSWVATLPFAAASAWTVAMLLGPAGLQ